MAYRGMILAVSILLCSSAFSRPKDDAKIESQIEAGFSLTQAAARRVLQKINFEPEPRTDYYVDIYDGQRFWLEGSDESHKLRLKVKDSKGVLQAKSLQKAYAQSCVAQASFAVKEKIIGERKLGKTDTQQFIQFMDEHMESLSSSNKARAVVDLKRFHDLVMGSRTPRLDVLLDVPKTSRWYFVGSHVARKTKWWASANEGRGSFQVSITEAKDYIGSLYWQDRYEIEFQLANTNDMSVDDFAASICKWMARMDFKAEDFHPERRDPQEETLRRLRLLNTDLGF